MIFFDQFKVPTIKFGKCFAEFMIPINFQKVHIIQERNAEMTYTLLAPVMIAAI